MILLGSAEPRRLGNFQWKRFEGVTTRPSSRTQVLFRGGTSIGLLRRGLRIIPKFCRYALILSSGMPVGFLRGRFRIIHSYAMLRLSHGGKYHRVENAHRVTPEWAPYNPKFYSYALIPSRGMPVGSLRGRFRTIQSYCYVALIPWREIPSGSYRVILYKPKFMKIGLLRSALRIIPSVTLMRSFH